MTILSPDNSLSNPTMVEIPKGFTLHRIHESKRCGKEFNPGFGTGRFSPLNDSPPGSLDQIPTLYASSAFETAVFETVCHDIDVRSRNKKVFYIDVLTLTHSVLTPNRDLHLVLLRNSTLMKWGLSRNNLINTTPKLYHQTALWARQVHKQFPKAQGIRWTSNKCDPFECFMFFGDMVSKDDFQIISKRDGRDYYSDLENVLKQSLISIV